MNNSFSTSNNKYSTSYNEKEHKTTYIPNISFLISKDKFFIKANNKLFLQLGFKEKLYSFGYMYSLGDTFKTVWKDPFLLNEKKQESHRLLHALFLNYNFKKSKLFSSSIKYKLIKNDIYKDETQKELQRDSLTNNITLSNRVFNIISNLNYTNSNAKGEASSFIEKGATLGFFIPIKKRVKLLSLYGKSYKKYQAINPIFNKTIKSKKDFFMFSLTVNEVSKKDYIKLSYINNIYKANENFYDSKVEIVAISYGLKF